MFLLVDYQGSSRYISFDVLCNWILKAISFPTVPEIGQEKEAEVTLLLDVSYKFLWEKGIEREVI